MLPLPLLRSWSPASWRSNACGQHSCGNDRGSGRRTAGALEHIRGRRDWYSKVSISQSAIVFVLVSALKLVIVWQTDYRHRQCYELSYRRVAIVVVVVVPVS